MPEGKHLMQEPGPRSKGLPNQKNKEEMTANLASTNYVGYRSGSTGLIDTELFAGTVSNHSL
jgi:hypothetical protein